MDNSTIIMAPSTQFLSSDSEDDEYLRLVEELKKRHVDEVARIESEHLVRKVAKAAERKRLVEETRCREEKEKQKAEEEKKEKKIEEARRGPEVVEQLEYVETLLPGEEKTRKRQLLEQGGSPNKKVRQEAGRTMKGNIGEDGPEEGLQTVPLGRTRMSPPRAIVSFIPFQRCFVDSPRRKSYACITCSESKQKSSILKIIKILLRRTRPLAGDEQESGPVPDTGVQSASKGARYQQRS